MGNPLGTILERQALLSYLVSILGATTLRLLLVHSYWSVFFTQLLSACFSTAIGQFSWSNYSPPASLLLLVSIHGATTLRLLLLHCYWSVFLEQLLSACFYYTPIGQYSWSDYSPPASTTLLLVSILDATTLRLLLYCYWSVYMERLLSAYLYSTAISLESH